MITQIRGEPRFASGLGRASAHTRYQRDITLSFPSGIGSESKNRLEQAVVANGELRSVYTNGQTASAGSEIVASERTLPALVELTILVDR